MKGAKSISSKYDEFFSLPTLFLGVSSMHKFSLLRISYMWAIFPSLLFIFSTFDVLSYYFVSKIGKIIFNLYRLIINLFVIIIYSLCILSTIFGVSRMTINSRKFNFLIYNLHT